MNPPATPDSYARLLQLPTAVDPAELSPDERVRMALYMMATEIHELRSHGCGMHGQMCERVERIERWRSWMIGGLAASSFFGGALLAVSLGKL